MPILVSPNVEFLENKGSILLNEKPFMGMIRIGFNDVAIFDKKSKTIFNIKGNINFKGRAEIGSGSKISVSGNLIFGRNFKITAETTIICEKYVVFGDNCLLSWDILIMDTDYHKIFDNEGKIINPNKEIIIGNNVWVGCRATILKGTEIKDNNVVAANSVVTKKLLEITLLLLEIQHMK